MNYRLWTAEQLAACGPIIHLITEDRVQEFMEDNYGRALTREELHHVSIALAENDDSEFLDAAVRRVIP